MYPDILPGSGRGLLLRTGGQIFLQAGTVNLEHCKG